MNISSIIAIIYFIFLVIMIVYVILRNKESPSTFAWIFIIVVLPIFGAIIYFLLGRSSLITSRKLKIYDQHFVGSMKRTLSFFMMNQKRAIKLLEDRKDYQFKDKLFQLLNKNSESLLTLRNRVEILQNGKEKFPKLIKDLKKAKSFIHMQYYIWEKDELTDSIIKILKKKVKEGVEVRILYDWFGSLFIPRRYIRKLRKEGIKIQPYTGPGTSTWFHTINYRDHSKIVIIDGKIGYNGGMNMAQEYIDGGKSFKKWRDTHLRIRGHAVRMLETIFAFNWKSTTGENLFKKKYYPKISKMKRQVPIQITSSGVEHGWNTIEQLYFQLINTAKKKVYIQTPYFIPNESIQTSLQTAALSGLDVRIMLTGVSDLYLPYWAAYTYFDELLSAGVKIYHYKKGLMHAKTITIDSEICSVGTANMDIRSLKLNREINTMIYDRKISEELEKDFLKDLKDCDEFTLNDSLRIGFFKRLRNSISRMLAPLL